MITREELDRMVAKLPNYHTDGMGYYRMPHPPRIVDVRDFDPGARYEPLPIQTITFDIREVMFEGRPISAYFYHDVLLKVCC